MNELRLTNKILALNIVKNDGLKLFFCSDELKNDKEVVLTSAQNNPTCIQYASEYLQKDIDVLNLFFKMHEQDNIENYSPKYQNWYNEKMKVWQIMNEQILMEKIITLNNNSSKQKKF